jgi:hypothetical protein
MKNPHCNCEPRLTNLEIALQGDITKGTTGVLAFVKTAGEDIYRDDGLIKTVNWHNKIIWMGGGMLILINLILAIATVYFLFRAIPK